MKACVVGVDVGGTNTDAVIWQGSQPIGSAKRTTTRDVTGGVTEAVRAALLDAKYNYHLVLENGKLPVSQVNIGTTHFVNAVIQKQDLAKVAVIRLCGTASHALPPFSDFPTELKQVISGGYHLVNGGYQYDGKCEITAINPEEILQCVATLKKEGIDNIVVAGLFSPVNPSQEIQVCEILVKAYPKASVTLSHTVGHNGLLERENAAVLNESLKPLCHRTIEAFRIALDNLGLTCPFYLTQNDGTLISADQARQLPVHTFASGPTNSMRGAARLSGLKNAVIVDIGGTTTDVGIIKEGFPREASTNVKVGGVKTNFRMPDVLSIGLGGGSIIQLDHNNKVLVGPRSVGYRLETEAKVFSGIDGTLTATDIAVAAGLCELGKKEHVKQVSQQHVNGAVDRIHQMLEIAIDQVKLSAEEVPVVLVGGGAILVDDRRTLKGISQLVKPEHSGVANAVGAAISQVSGIYDKIVDMTEQTREEALACAEQSAIAEAVKAGAEPADIQIVEKDEIHVAYLPGNIARLKVKAVGNLNPEKVKITMVDLSGLFRELPQKGDKCCCLGKRYYNKTVLFQGTLMLRYRRPSLT